MHDVSGSPGRSTSVLPYARPAVARGVRGAAWVLQVMGVLLMLAAAVGAAWMGIEEMCSPSPMPAGDYLFRLFILGTPAAVGVGEFVLGRRVRQNHRRAIAAAIALLGGKGIGLVVILGFIAADVVWYGFKWWLHAPVIALFALPLSASVWLIAALVAARRQLAGMDAERIDRP